MTMRFCWLDKDFRLRAGLGQPVSRLSDLLRLQGDIDGTVYNATLAKLPSLASVEKQGDARRAPTP
jgi:hypothetical protein